jgi:hypothetical protein
MFVLCDNCHNHYDDTCQSEECDILEVWDESLTAFPLGPHQQVVSSPIEDHLACTRAARVHAEVRSVPYVVQNGPYKPLASLFGVPTSPGG